MGVLLFKEEGNIESESKLKENKCAFLSIRPEACWYEKIKVKQGDRLVVHIYLARGP